MIRDILAQAVWVQQCESPGLEMIPVAPWSRPKPTPEHMAWPAIPGGPLRLRAQAVRFLQRLHTSELSNIQKFVVQDLQSCVRVGTGCSGTDSPLLSLHALSEALREHLGLNLEIKPVWSCETKTGKREFIKAVWPGATVFKDLHETKSGVATEHSGEQLEVNEVDMFVAGFPCTSASRLNVHSRSASNLSCIQRKELATGSVFDALVSTVARPKVNRRLKWLALENVTDLVKIAPGGRSNFDWVCHTIKERLNMITIAWHLTPTDFGCCQRRPRLWMLCVKESDLSMSEAEAREYANSLMCRLTGSQMTALDEVLLPPGHQLLTENHKVNLWKNDPGMASVVFGGVMAPAVTRTRRQCQGHGRPGINKQMTSKSILVHKDHFIKRGMRPKEFTDMDYMIHPGIAAMTTRELWVAQLAGVQNWPEENPSALELSQSFGRQKVSLGVSPCIIPKGRIYFPHLCRLQLPIESLRLQGIFYDADIVTSFPEKMVADLAGNAFETTSCLACVVVGIALLSCQ